MPASRENSGFTLIELLLVLAILGIISAIAIPAYLGQRRRARVIGDAIANAQNLRMLLETRKADAGVYGPVASYTWISGSASDPTFLPNFNPAGNSQMNYSISITGGGLTYEITCTDPSIGSGVTAFRTNQNGDELERLH